MSSVILLVVGDDRPGLVEALAEVVAGHGGSWSESRMLRLSGKFAGIVQAEVPAEQAQAFRSALGQLEASAGVSIVVEDSVTAEARDLRCLRLELVGNDRPGIIREITSALAQGGVNLDELSSECESAPMTGGMLFRATATLRVPPELDIDELREHLESLAQDLMVDLSLDG